MKFPHSIKGWNALVISIISFAIFIIFFVVLGLVMPRVFTRMIKKVRTLFLLSAQKWVIKPKFDFCYFMQQLNTAPDSDVRPLYEKVPFFLDFRIYMFNCTNPDEVTKGSVHKWMWKRVRYLQLKIVQITKCVRENVYICE